MSQRNLYFYCPEIKHLRSGASCDAVLLSPHPAQDLETETFQAFLLPTVGL